MVFSGECKPAGDGFVVLDGSGIERLPDNVSSVDKLTWVLSFDDPLAEGAVGVRWSVAAPDAHPIEGSFSFMVASTDVSPSDAPSQTAATDLDDFLETEADGPALVGAVGILGRSLSLAGALVGIGGVLFAAWVLRGSPGDIRSVLFWVRRASVLLGAGVIIELVHQAAVVKGGWLNLWRPTTIAEVLGSAFGLAILLRLVGAGFLLRAHLDVIPAHQVKDPVVAVQTAVGVGAGPALSDSAALDHPTAGEPYAHRGDYAWKISGETRLIAIGVFLLLLSYVFDGHTVTEGIRGVTALVDIIHVGAGAIWAGGLVMLVHVVWRRHRRRADVRALQLAVRFSVVAAAALVVTGAAGLVLAVTIADDVSDLWSTPWGLVLMAKLAIVAVAAAAGGYNHKVLIPRMTQAGPDSSEVDAEFRRAVSWEGAAMALVIILTAVLVGSAS